MQKNYAKECSVGMEDVKGETNSLLWSASAIMDGPTLITLVPSLVFFPTVRLFHYLILNYICTHTHTSRKYI